MALPTPEAGLVIGYEYLWRWEANAKRETGAKTRPAVIVLVAGDGPDVMVVPVTTQRPDDQCETVAIPEPVAAYLGLDTTRSSWVVVDEVNMFRWPTGFGAGAGRCAWSLSLWLGTAALVRADQTSCFEEPPGRYPSVGETA